MSMRTIAPEPGRLQLRLGQERLRIVARCCTSEALDALDHGRVCVVEAGDEWMRVQVGEVVARELRQCSGEISRAPREPGRKAIRLPLVSA
jgi:hypothetical protein